MDKISRFWNKVDKSGDCWLWTGAKNRDGYGTTNTIESNTLAHRVSFTLERGPIPSGLCVLHVCDVRDCVNPEHLFLGTRADNCRDRHAKGRTVLVPCFGTTNGKVSLTDDQVAEIRSLYTPGKGATRLAEKFGVSHSTLINIAVGRRRQCKT